jgi:hypothetical protein
LSSSNNSNICLQCKIENCVQCGKGPGADSFCEKCERGYSVSPNGDKCVQCLYPCSTCTAGPGPNNCATCFAPMFFRKANADGSCKKNMISGCK